LKWSLKNTIKWMMNDTQVKSSLDISHTLSLFSNGDKLTMKKRIN
jgi:hypothetical protein